MKITIDTREESVEDMKKLIRMLQNIVESRTPSSTLLPSGGEGPGAEDSGGLFNMFGEDSSAKNESEEKDDVQGDEENKTPKVEIVEF